MVAFEKPPYYRPPRHRPVALEEPKQSAGNMQHDGQSNLHYANLLNSLPNHNRMPQPFNGHCKRDFQNAPTFSLPGGNFPNGHELPSSGPRIVVEQHQDDECGAKRSSNGPTSTVHKSMLTSGRSAGCNTYANQPVAMEARSHQIDEIPCQSCFNQRQLRFSRDCECQKEAARLEQQQVCSASQPDWCRQWPNAPWALTGPEPKAKLGSEQMPLAGRIRRYGQTVGGSKQQSSSMRPDTKQDEFMRTKRLEQATIAHQTYRTLPIVQPKPKARHDIALNTTYMNLNQDPTYDLALESCKNSKAAMSRSFARKIEAAMQEGRRFIQQ